MIHIHEMARRVLQSEANAITALIERIGHPFEKAVMLMDSCKGRVVLSGMGKSGIICKKIAATLSSTGIPSLFIHPSEAIHGDLGMIVPGDVLIVISNSGETEELFPLLEWVKRVGVPLISMVGSMDSTVGRHSDVALDVSVTEEACPLNLVPTASTTAALAMGDALAMCLMEKRGFRPDDFRLLHPGGKLGKKLLKVADLMRSGSRIPVVSYNTPMKDVVHEISRKGIGVTSVVDQEERVVGIISDGDLRRHLEKDDLLLQRTAGDCMIPNPKIISEDELATKALNLMENMKITSLFVLDDQRRMKGIIHIHDLWQTQMF